MQPLADAPADHVAALGVPEDAPGTPEAVPSPPRLVLRGIIPEERQRFLDQLATYLAAMYPGCPSGWRLRLVDRARRGGHSGRLAEIAGILIHNSIRHNATDYERLLRINGGLQGLTREEARMVVAKEVEDRARAWRQGAPEDDPGYCELRRVFRKRWQKRGRKKARPGLVAEENAALSAYLAEWLRAREAEAEGSPQEPPGSPSVLPRSATGRSPGLSAPT